jgi:RNA-binding protein YhbY
MSVVPKTSVSKSKTCALTGMLISELSRRIQSGEFIEVKVEGKRFPQITKESLALFLEQRINSAKVAVRRYADSLHILKEI